jgi:hypothetical protein
VLCVRTARLWTGCYPRRMSEQGAKPIETSPAPETAPEPKIIEVGDDPFSLTGADPEPEEPARPSRTRRIVLSSLLAVGLAGAAVLGYAGWTIASQKDATLTTPATVAGLRLDTSAEGKSTADYLRTALSAEVQLDKAVAAVYDDGKESVLFLGGTGLIWTPEDDLDTAFGLISDAQGSVTGLHKVPAGKLGGTMKCGTTVTDDGNMSVCGWADHGSLALAMFPSRSESDAAALLVQIRDAAQTRAG